MGVCIDEYHHLLESFQVALSCGAVYTGLVMLYFLLLLMKHTLFYVLIYFNILLHMRVHRMSARVRNRFIPAQIKTGKPVCYCK